MRTHRTEQQPSYLDQALAMLGTLDQHRLAQAHLAQQPLQQRMQELQLQEMENPNSPTHMGGYAKIIDSIGMAAPYLKDPRVNQMLNAFNVPGTEPEQDGSAALREMMMRDPRGAQLLQALMQAQNPQPPQM